MDFNLFACTPETHSRTLSPMRIFVTSATIGEWMPSFLELDALFTRDSKRLKVAFHQSGVGMLSTAVSLMQLIYTEKPDLIIQAGIAGAFSKDIKLGSIYTINEEQIGDMGVWEDEKWKDIFDLKLEKSSYHPFEKRKLANPWLADYNVLKLPVVNAVTVNQITTSPQQMHTYTKKYDATLESMEGAALHFVCRMMNTPFIQIRAISNYVGVRDKTQWDIKLSLSQLNTTLVKMIEKIYKLP